MLTKYLNFWSTIYPSSELFNTHVAFQWEHILFHYRWPIYSILRSWFYSWPSLKEWTLFHQVFPFWVLMLRWHILDLEILDIYRINPKEVDINETTDALSQPHIANNYTTDIIISRFCMVNLLSSVALSIQHLHLEFLITSTTHVRAWQIPPYLSQTWYFINNTAGTSTEIGQAYPIIVLNSCSFLKWSPDCLFTVFFVRVI